MGWMVHDYGITNMRSIAHATSIALISLACWEVFAVADGPDHFQVTGGQNGDVLNIRTEPNSVAAKIGEIPPDGTCIRNLGCRGGLTLHEYTTLSEHERQQRLKENPRWCKIEYQGTIGWVAGRYLIEGSCPSGLED